MNADELIEMLKRKESERAHNTDFEYFSVQNGEKAVVENGKINNQNDVRLNPTYEKKSKISCIFEENCPVLRGDKRSESKPVHTAEHNKRVYLQKKRGNEFEDIQCVSNNDRIEKIENKVAERIYITKSNDMSNANEESEQLDLFSGEGKRVGLDEAIMLEEKQAFDINGEINKQNEENRAEKCVNFEKEIKREYNETAKNEQGETVLSIEVSKILPNPSQPRKNFSEESIIKLAESIREYGIIQPLSVRYMGEYYELVAGERRLRAAKELGLTHVPCILFDVSDSESAEISIIENLLRENLTMFEEAEAFRSLIDTYGLTQEQIARKIASSQSYVGNKLRLLRLTPSERKVILENNLTERHARALLRVTSEEERARLLNKIVKESLNVAKTEELIDSVYSGEERERIPPAYKDVRSFHNAISRAIEMITNSGVKVKQRRVEGDSYIEYTIVVPKSLDSEKDKALV